jgi:excisionase family DNA binding protein
VRTAAIVDARRSESDELLTTGEVARILGVSRQHVVDLCDRGLLPFVTTGRHRRVRRGDVESVQRRSPRMSREERRSIWLNVAVAGELVRDPEEVLRRARTNLASMRAEHPRGQRAHWLEEWQDVLSLPVEEIVATLVSPSRRSTELRQNSPFAGIVDEDDRRRVLEAFSRAASSRARRPG